MRWGLLGYGRIARKFEESINHSDHEIVAIASRSGQQSIPAQYRAYGSYDQLCGDQEVDIIYVSTTHNFHADHTIKALNAGKHVLCEKPMATSVEEVRNIIGAAEGSGRFLMEALWSRFLPGYQKALSMIRDGRIGEVQMINAHFGFKMDPNDPKERLIRPDLAAGAVWDVGIYPLSLAQDVFEEMPDTIQVHALVTALGVENRCSMQLGYAPDRVAQLSCAVDLNTVNKATITGTLGSVIMEDFWKCERFTLLKNGQREDFYFPMISNGLVHEAIACGTLIEQDKTQSPLMSWDHSLQLSQIMEKIINMARS